MKNQTFLRTLSESGPFSCVQVHSSASLAPLSSELHLQQQVHQRPSGGLSLLVHPLPKGKRSRTRAHARKRVNKTHTAWDQRPRARSHATLLFGETSQIRMTRVMHQQKTTRARTHTHARTGDPPPQLSAAACHLIKYRNSLEPRR